MRRRRPTRRRSITRLTKPSRSPAASSTRSAPRRHRRIARRWRPKNERKRRWGSRDNRRCMTRLGAFILIAFVAAGCGGSSSNPAAPGSGTAGAGNVSAIATSYLNEVLGLMQKNSINRARINWTDFRSQVFQRAQGAQIISDTYPAISVALGLLDDHHSFFTQPPGGVVTNPSTTRG